jgi:hypothetical protein
MAKNNAQLAIRTDEAAAAANRRPYKAQGGSGQPWRSLFITWLLDEHDSIGVRGADVLLSPKAPRQQSDEPVWNPSPKLLNFVALRQTRKRKDLINSI